MPTERLVSLMELLQVYAHRYVEKLSIVSMFSDFCRDAGDRDMRQYGKIDVLFDALHDMAELCKTGELPVTLKAVESAEYAIAVHKSDDSPAAFNAALKHFLEQIKSRLPDELATKLFLQLPFSRKELFEKPCTKWETVIARFPATVRDIEEAGKCFALSRYAACVFHCVQIVELALLPLGAFLSVKDPISGWTAVANRLKVIATKPYQERDAFERQHFSFIEQMQGTVEALKNAWRNKISHAQGQRLLLVSSDFTPDTAEEIMSATRSLVRRLAEELPESQNAKA